ncbi:MAG TPA: hypothetical protein VH370_10535 [Humisphaera sp.]|jgi:hypothetical protein|nr:hypothetical protein [Humisphaera sp.]
MTNPPQSQQARNKANTRRNWDRIEQHLTEVEKVQGSARAWKLREQLEQGHITINDLKRR